MMLKKRENTLLVFLSLGTNWAIKLLLPVNLACMSVTFLLANRYTPEALIRDGPFLGYYYITCVVDSK